MRADSSASCFAGVTLTHASHAVLRQGARSFVIPRRKTANLSHSAQNLVDKRTRATAPRNYLAGLWDEVYQKFQAKRFGDGVSMTMTIHSTATTSPAQRAGHWDAVIAETYFPLHLTFRDAATFDGQLERRVIGPVSMSRLQTEAMQYERRPRHISEAREEEYLITIPRRSPVEFRQLGRDVRCDPGGFLLERGDEPYKFSYAAANDLCVLKISKAVLSEKLRQPDRFCAKIFDGTTGVGGLFTMFAQKIFSQAPLNANSEQVLGRQLIELLALSLDRQSDADDGVKSSVRAAHLRRAEAMIRTSLADPALSPELVADACGISKRYLHELFSGANITVSQYIREQRLIAARDILELPNHAPIAEIAYRFGFSDQAQFSRLFKAMFGRTPSGYRARGAVAHIP
jgi:AraC-like DNA-binding protein